MDIKSRLPTAREMFHVYSITVFLEYTWMVLLFSFILPGMLLTVTTLEVFWAFSYDIFFVFLDSLALFFLVVLCAALLPAKWIRNEFTSRGGMLALMFFLWILILKVVFINQYSAMFILALLGVLLHSAVMVFFTARLPILKRIMDGMASRAVIFPYLYLPLSLVGFFVILIRNLL